MCKVAQDLGKPFQQPERLQETVGADGLQPHGGGGGGGQELSCQLGDSLEVRSVPLHCQVNLKNLSSSSRKRQEVWEC